MQKPAIQDKKNIEKDEREGVERRGEMKREIMNKKEEEKNL